MNPRLCRRSRRPSKEQDCVNAVSSEPEDQNEDDGILDHARSGLTTRAQPRRAGGGEPRSGTQAAPRRWLQRFCRPCRSHTQKSLATMAEESRQGNRRLKAERTFPCQTFRCRHRLGRHERSVRLPNPPKSPASETESPKTARRKRTQRTQSNGANWSNDRTERRRGPARPHRQLTWPARVRSSDFVSCSWHLSPQESGLPACAPL